MPQRLGQPAFIDQTFRAQRGNGRLHLIDATARPIELSRGQLRLLADRHFGVGCDQILPVDIEAIMKGGSTATNYQLLPGDRVFIAQDPWFAFNSIVDKITAPFERIFGFTLIGASTVQSIARFGQLGFGVF
jgi:hypothetical protein